MIKDVVHPTETAGGATLPDGVLSDCVQAAVAAPSLHNSQPWQFRIAGGGVEVFADRSRQLEVIDPSGRELLISVGAAMFNLRLAMRHHGRQPVLDLFPDDSRPDLVARVRPGRALVPSEPVETLHDAIARRHTNRWPFTASVVPADVIERLVAAAGTEGATLTVAGAAARNAILSLTDSAERRLRAHGAYRAELGRWTIPVHGRGDGIPTSVVGPWDAMEVMPIRDFGLLQPQPTRASERFEPFPTILVLSTHGDHREQWVSAGQALERVLLAATVQGLATTPISQPLEILAIRDLLTDTGKGDWAQMVLRVGYGRPSPVTPRRQMSEVLLAADTDFPPRPPAVTGTFPTEGTCRIHWDAVVA
jgi:nitroreductase